MHCSKAQDAKRDGSGDRRCHPCCSRYQAIPLDQKTCVDCCSSDCCCLLRSCRLRCASLIRALVSREGLCIRFMRISSFSQLFRAPSLIRALCSGESCRPLCAALIRARASGVCFLPVFAATIFAVCSGDCFLPVIAARNFALCSGESGGRRNPCILRGRSAN